MFHMADYCFLCTLAKLPIDDRKGDGNMLVTNKVIQHFTHMRFFLHK